MRVQTIFLKPLIKIESIDSKGDRVFRGITEYELEMAQIGDEFSAYCDDAICEEVLQLVGYDEEGYYATLSTYQNDMLKMKELIIFTREG